MHNKEEEIKFKKENLGLDDGEFKPFGNAKHEEDDPNEHLDFDFSDDADVEKKEKMSAYTKDLSFDTGQISEENKKIWKLVQAEDGEEANDEDDEDDGLQQFLKSESKDATIKSENSSEQKGKKGRKKRSGEESTYMLQPKKKIVKENGNLPEGALTELEIEAEIRKFFLIRPSIEPRLLLTHFKKVIKATPEGDKVFLKIIQRICKRKDKESTILVLKDDIRTYH